MLRFALATGAIVAAACAYDAPVKPDTRPSMQLTATLNADKSYLIDFTGNTLPAGLAVQIAKAGGVLTTSIDQIGVAVATSPPFSALFAAPMFC